MFVRTFENVLIQIDPSTKIPRTYKRFAGLFAQLLKNLKIRALNTNQTLLKIVKNPVTDHLPINTKIVGTSSKGKPVNIKSFVSENLQENIAFVVGAVAKGNPGMEVDYVKEAIKISNFSLSASNCLYKIISAFEDLKEVDQLQQTEES